MVINMVAIMEAIMDYGGHGRNDDYGKGYGYGRGYDYEKGYGGGYRG